MAKLELKIKYNILLERERKAEAWLGNPARTDVEVKKWMPEFQRILAELNSIISEIGAGNCTVAERMKGFDIISLLGHEVGLDKLPGEWKEKVS